VDAYHPDYPDMGSGKVKKKAQNNGKRRRRMLRRHPFCRYCGCHVNDENSTLDHVIPRSKGGHNGMSNVVLCCLNCNARKGDKDVSVFLQELREEGIIGDSGSSR
jgi:5-methylcytosine-specific restriction endonuclease McrA